MKANEAPRKSYLLPKGLISYCRNLDEDVEYIRKDAFIEKACDFFEENIEEEDCKIGSSELTELRAEYKSLDSFIRAFVKYMKGDNMTNEIGEIKECGGKISSNIVTVENNWYVCIKQLNNFEVGKVYCMGKNSVIAVPEYFRLATDEEISQGASMQNTDTTEPTGVRLEKCPKAQKGEEV